MEDCLKYLKEGWNKKEGGETKILKRGRGKLGQGVGALERGLDPPYELCRTLYLSFSVFLVILNKSFAVVFGNNWLLFI